MLISGLDPFQDMDQGKKVQFGILIDFDLF